MIRTAVLHLLYPIVIAYGLISYILLQNAGYSIVLSTYVPAVSGAILIVILEFMFPYRKDWIPNRTDMLNDLIFMRLVQVFLPKNRAVEELGLKNRDYPLDFASQMKTPFIKGVDQGS